MSVDFDYNRVDIDGGSYGFITMEIWELSLLKNQWSNIKENKGDRVGSA